MLAKRLGSGNQGPPKLVVRFPHLFSLPSALHWPPFGSSRLELDVSLSILHLQHFKTKPDSLVCQESNNLVPESKPWPPVNSPHPKF